MCYCIFKVILETTWRLFKYIMKNNAIIIKSVKDENMVIWKNVHTTVWNKNSRSDSRIYGIWIMGKCAMCIYTFKICWVYTKMLILVILNGRNLCFFSLFIYSYVHTLFGPFLPLHPPQNRFCILLQFWWREDISNNKKDIAFLLVEIRIAMSRDS
jgi:hypothetical protein